MNSLTELSSDKFWTSDPTVLYKNNSYVKIVPEYNDSREEQLNSITRACIYFLIICLAFGVNEQWLYPPVVIVTMCVLFYYIDRSDSNRLRKRSDKIMKSRVTKDSKKISRNNFVDSDSTMGEETEESSEKQTIEAGFYDSSGSLVLGEEHEAPVYHKDTESKIQSMYTVDEINQYKNATCKRPTRDNPFMNPELSDYNNHDPPAACNADDDEIKDEITKNFNKDMYMNLDDVWEKKNSQRQFYTLPATGVPNDQAAFANWLYNSPKTCKEDQEGCLRYEDIRFKR